MKKIYNQPAVLVNTLHAISVLCASGDTPAPAPENHIQIGGGLEPEKAF